MGEACGQSTVNFHGGGRYQGVTRAYTPEQMDRLGGRDIPAWVTSIAPAAALIALQATLWPISLGSYVSGLILGSLFALTALAMALVWRANRVVNFAQGEMGALPATFAMLLMSAWGLPYLAGVVVGMATAVVLGGAIDLFIIRRFAKSPRLVVLVATLGLGQMLAFLTLVVPSWFGEFATIRTFAPPFELTFSIGQVVFDANDVIGATVAVVVGTALVVFLRTTDVGVAIRAAAEGADRANMLGVPVARLGSVVWALAGFLGFCGVFFGAGVTALAPGFATSLLVVVQAMAALVIGRMTNLLTIATTAVALGIVDAGIRANSDTGIWIAPLLAALIVVALLFQRRGSSRVEADRSASWALAGTIRPVPAAVAALTPVRLAKWGSVAVLAAVALAAPHVVSTGVALKVGALFIFATIGMSLVVLAGWAGLVSLGQMTFVGMGGAIAAWATVDRGLDPIVSIIAAGLVGALLAVIVGLPALRIRGFYLGVTTLALALAFRSAVFNNAVVDWIPFGTFDRPSLFGVISLESATRVYYLALATMVLCAGGALGIRRSRTGRVLMAVRDNEPAAAAFGVSVVRAKLSAFAASGFIAAVAGAVLVFHQASFRSDLFDPGESLSVFTSTVVGGVGSLWGAVAGATFSRGSEWVLPSDWALLASGVGALFVLLAMPDGLAGVGFRVRDQWFRWLAARRGLAVPSLRGNEEAAAELEDAA